MEAEILTTGVGSVPFTDPHAAVAHVFDHYSMPFFPQLVRLDRSGIVPMLAEILTPPMRAAVAARATSDFDNALAKADADSCVRQLPGFDAFIRCIKPGQRIKLQMIGPRTAALILAETLQNADAASKISSLWTWLERLTRAWLDAVRPRTSGPITVIWDDGLLATQSHQGERRRFAEWSKELSTRNARLGLHCCAPARVTEILRAFPTAVLSLDLNVVDLFCDSETIRMAKAHAPGFLFGVFDTRETSLDVKKGEVLARHVSAEFETCPSPLVFTGGCGTGLHTEPYERTLAATLQAIATIH